MNNLDIKRKLEIWRCLYKTTAKENALFVNSSPNSYQMAATAEEVPLIVIQPDKMLNSWTSTLKLSVFMFVSLATCACLYVYAKILYLRTKKLVHISAMALNAEKMMDHLYLLELNVSRDIEQLNNIVYEDLDYYDNIIF